MEFSTGQLKSLAEELAHMIGNEIENEDQLTGRNIEEGIRQCLRKMGQMTYGMVLTNHDTVPEREIACECGGQLHY